MFARLPILFCCFLPCMAALLPMAYTPAAQAATVLPTAGSEAGIQSAAAARARAAALAAQQQETERQAARLKEEANAASTDLSTLQERLVKASAAERGIADKLHDLLARTATLEARQAELNTSLGTKRQDLAALLVGLARLSRLPPEVGLLRDGNTEEAIHTALLLQSALPAVKAQAQQLTTSLQDLDRVQKQLAEERAELDATRAAMAAEETQIETLIHARQKKLQLTAAQQGEIAGRLDKLRAESTNVQDLIRRVASPRPAPRPDAPPAQPPVLALRGGFLQPVTGEVIRQFGQPDEVGAKSMGISFRPQGSGAVTGGGGSGARIVAPARGRVMFAGPFRGYGQIVILEHEGDMHSLIAGFGRLDVTVGQKVAQGEPLGLAGAGANGAGGQNVYFELRFSGEPIDPRLRQH